MRTTQLLLPGPRKTFAAQRVLPLPASWSTPLIERRADDVIPDSTVLAISRATILNRAGLSARAIAGHIGHARPSITRDVYMDKRSAGREAADAFEAALGPISGGEKCQ